MRTALCVLLLLGAGCSKRDIPTSKAKPVFVAWTKATGVSMLPTFPESALIQLEFGLEFKDLKKGDTVVFWDYKRGDKAFTHHRLVSQGIDGNWIAQGDNTVTNSKADQSWVTPDNFIARSTGRYTQFLIP